MNRQLAADALRAVTGFDVAAAWRGQYDSAAGAARILADEGGVRGLATAVLGEPCDNPLMAGRGDIVCVDLDGRDTLGVVAGNGCWCAPGVGGLVFRPMTEVSTVWGI